MKRTLVQFDEETYRRLREQAFRQERSMSSVVRELVARGLDSGHIRRKSPGLGDFASVGSGRSKQRRLSPVSEKHDEVLAAIEK